MQRCKVMSVTCVHGFSSQPSLTYHHKFLVRLQKGLGNTISSLHIYHPSSTPKPPCNHYFYSLPKTSLPFTPLFHTTNRIIIQTSQIPLLSNLKSLLTNFLHEESYILRSISKKRACVLLGVQRTWVLVLSPSLLSSESLSK